MTGPILYTAHSITSCLTRSLFNIIQSTETEDAYAKSLMGAIANVAIINKCGKSRIQICISKQSDVREATFRQFYSIVSRYYEIDVVMPNIEGGVIKFIKINPMNGQKLGFLKWSQPNANQSGDNFKRILPWVKRMMEEGKGEVLFREIALQGSRFHNAGRSGGRVANLDIVLFEGGKVQVIDVKTGIRRSGRKKSSLIIEFENLTSIYVREKYVEAA